jgi:hypothetical protein
MAKKVKGRNKEWEEFLDKLDSYFEGRKKEEVWGVIGGIVAGIIFFYGYFLYPMVIDYKDQNIKRYEKLTGEVRDIEKNITSIKQEIAATQRKIKIKKQVEWVLRTQRGHVKGLADQLEPLQFTIEKWVEYLNFIADTTQATGLKFERLTNVIYLPPPEKNQSEEEGKLAKLKKKAKKLAKKARKIAKKAEVAVKKATVGLSGNEFLFKRMDLNLTGSGPYKNVVDFVYNLEKRKDLVKVKGFSMDTNKTFHIQVEVYGFRR